MLCLKRPTEFKLTRILATESDASLTYPEVGATTSDHLPVNGYRHDRLSVQLGFGQELFERCAEHLDNWGLQESVGFSVFPEQSRASDGETVLLSLPFPGFFFIASARVVYTVRDKGRHGFAYGTLPTHPERGEEYFGIAIDSDETVTFELRAFSRPQALLARIGGPVTRQIQLAATRRYGAAMKAFAAGIS